LEIAFETRELRSICEHKEVASATLGDEIADDLKRRLADLRAAKSIEDLIAGNPIIINNQEGSYLVIHLKGRSQIVLAPNHVNNPPLETGEIDWTSVTRLKVVQIGGA
jgi:hypothetical protein